MDFEQIYKEETGFDVGKIHDIGVMYYSDDYVNWLEEKLLIQRVVVPKGTLCDLDGKKVMVKFKVTKYIPKIFIEDI